MNCSSKNYPLDGRKELNIISLSATVKNALCAAIVLIYLLVFDFFFFPPGNFTANIVAHI